MSPAPARRAAVVVPAHDEELLLPACLRSIAEAAHHSPVPVDVIVVADDCRDATVAIARTAGEAFAPTVLDVNFRNVGLARAAGVAAAIDRSGPADLLVLCTDADSTVPADWIARHLGHVGRGADLVVGTVRPADWRHWSRRVAREYRRRYRAGVQGDAHGHIHGANLGMVAMRYLDLGGFAGLSTGEDVHLVDAARAAGLRVVFATDLAVRTSTRPLGRAPDGFSAHLQSLAGAQRTG